PSAGPGRCRGRPNLAADDAPRPGGVDRPGYPGRDRHGRRGTPGQGGCTVSVARRPPRSEPVATSGPGPMCRVCGLRRPRLAIEHEDPFCSVKCAKVAFGVRESVRTPKEPERPMTDAADA